MPTLKEKPARARYVVILLVLGALLIGFGIHRTWWLPREKERGFLPYGEVSTIKTGPEWVPATFSTRVFSLNLDWADEDIPSLRACKNLSNIRLNSGRGNPVDHFDASGCQKLETLSTYFATSVHFAGCEQISTLQLWDVELSRCRGWESLDRLIYLHLARLNPSEHPTPFPPIPNPGNLIELSMSGAFPTDIPWDKFTSLGHLCLSDDVPTDIPWDKLTSLYQLILHPDNPTPEHIKGLDLDRRPLLGSLIADARLFSEKRLDLSARAPEFTLNLNRLPEKFHILLPTQPWEISLSATEMKELTLEFPSASDLEISEVMEMWDCSVKRIVLISDGPIEEVFKKMSEVFDVAEIEVRHLPAEATYSIQWDEAQKLKRVILPQGSRFEFVKDGQEHPLPDVIYSE